MNTNDYNDSTELLENSNNEDNNESGFTILDVDNNFKELLVELKKRNNEKESEIKNLITDLSTKINDSTDAMTIGSLITDLLKSHLKNDENLIKVIQVLNNRKIKFESKNDINGNSEEVNESEKLELLEKIFNKDEKELEKLKNNKIINFTKTSSK